MSAGSVRRGQLRVNNAYVVVQTNREALQITGRVGRRLLLFPIHVHCAVRVVYPVNQHGWHVINVLYNYG